MANNPGYIYILYNPSVEGFVKIGKTTKDPQERAKELSTATGVPSPFIVVYEAFFQDCTSAELFVHTLLNDKRVSNNKEFFRTSVTEAVNAIIQAKNKLSSEPSSDDISEENIDDDLDNELGLSEEIWQDILDTADAYYYGSGDFLQDYEEAIKLYKQAAKLGSVKAFHQIGDMFRDGEGVNQDTKLAVYYYKEAASRGDDICWGDMAISYYELKEYTNADKCWLKLFTSPSMKGKENELGFGFYTLKFMEFMYSVSRWPHHSALKSFYQDMIKGKKEEEIKYLIYGSK